MPAASPRSARSRDVVKRPLHPYAVGLMGAIPAIDGDARAPGADSRLHAATVRHPAGCAFHPRCAHAFARCRIERPEPLPRDGRRVACHLLDEASRQSPAPHLEAVPRERP